MKNILTFLVSFFLFAFATAQSSYTISWGTGTYDTLTNYNSLLLENHDGDFSLWWLGELEVEFGFDFPYFDKTYSGLVLESDGYGYFPGNNTENYNLYLFAGEYENLGAPMLKLVSDWRYAHETERNMDVLKIEWKDVGILEDVESDSPSDHYINYQAWFFENGEIELHFGEIDLANSPFYDPAKGFVFEDGESYGPWLGIGNDDATDVYYLTNTFTDPVVITSEDSSSVILEVPPAGQYVRFSPEGVVNQKEAVRIVPYIRLYPTPSSDHISWEWAAPVAPYQIRVINVQGQLLKAAQYNESRATMSLTTLPAGIYVLAFYQDGRMLAARRFHKM